LQKRVARLNVIAVVGSEDLDLVHAKTLIVVAFIAARENCNTANVAEK
jgi:hypothetical protein